MPWSAACPRFLARFLARVLYRFRVFNPERVPTSGGCLIVCNRVSLLDRVILRAASQRRLTIAVNADRPEAILAALGRGEAVLLFPEGHRTRSGHLLPFNPKLEAILAGMPSDMPVIPACTDGLWGGVFTFHGGRTWGKRPRAFRPPVAVMFGKPLPHGLSAAETRLAVQELTADCAIRQSDFTPLVHRAFVRNAVKLRNLFRPCVADYAAGEKVLTWGKVFVAAVCVTRFLRSRIGNEPNIGVWLPTGLGSALTNLAIAFLGRSSVNLNYTAGPDSVRSAARQAGLRVVITSRRFLTRFPLDLPEDIPRIELEDVLAAVTKGQKLRAFLTALLLPGWFIERFILGLHRHAVDDVLTIVFSSGSTGEPKGVVLTHRNVGSNVDSAIRTIQIRSSDSLFGVLPFFHSFGYTVCLWAPLVARAKAVYYPDPRGAKEVGQIVRSNRATLMLSTATFLRFYLRRCDPEDFRSLRILICGAEKLPIGLQDDFYSRFGVLPLEGYGCTELSPVVSTNLDAVTACGVTQECNVRGTIGQPIQGVCVRAFTLETREPLPIGQEGVLCSKGPNVMAGYLHQPAKTTDAIRDGWYSTGDMGIVRPDGFIQITGRMSRFAKIAGEMIPLERLEEELHDLHGAAERVLAVAAVPDEKRGERLVVLYLPELDGLIGGLLNQLAKRGLPNLWIPDPRDAYRVDALPVLGSGKLDLKRVGELAKELAGRTP